jgi:hypothetical protein
MANRGLLVTKDFSAHRQVYFSWWNQGAGRGSIGRFGIGCIRGWYPDESLDDPGCEIFHCAGPWTQSEELQYGSLVQALGTGWDLSSTRFDFQVLVIVDPIWSLACNCGCSILVADRFRSGLPEVQLLQATWLLSLDGFGWVWMGLEGSALGSYCIVGLYIAKRMQTSICMICTHVYFTCIGW